MFHSLTDDEEEENEEEGLQRGTPIVSRLARAAIAGGAARHAIASSELTQAFSTVSFVEPLDGEDFEYDAVGETVSCRSSGSDGSDGSGDEAGEADGEVSRPAPYLPTEFRSDAADGPFEAVRQIGIDKEPLDPDTVQQKGPASGDAADPKGRGMGTLALVSVVYFLVCGGAYGTEDLAGAVPPLFALLGILIIPWIWSLPTALVTAELATAFPSDTGFVGWTRSAWGNRLAFLDGFIMTQVVIIDQAVYPTIFVAYLENFVTLSPVIRWAVSAAYILLCLLINLLGAKGVSRASATLQVVALFPFALFAILGAASQRIEPARWLSTDGPWNLDLYVSVLIWATCGWEYTGFVASQVRRPARTFPRALACSAFLMVLTYMLPIMVAIGIVVDPSQITQGWFPRLGNMVGFGDWVGHTLIVGGLGSTMGTYLSYLLTSASGLRAVAKEGGAPRLFARLDQYQPPVVALLFYSLTTAVLVLFEFDVLVQLETFFFCVHTIILMSLLPRLRRQRPDVPRPFRVGAGVLGVYGLPILPVLVSLYNIWYTEWQIQLTGTGICIVTLLTHAAYQRWWVPRRQRRSHRSRHHHHHHHHHLERDKDTPPPGLTHPYPPAQSRPGAAGDSDIRPTSDMPYNVATETSSSPLLSGGSNSSPPTDSAKSAMGPQKVRL